MSRSQIPKDLKTAFAGNSRIWCKFEVLHQSTLQKLVVVQKHRRAVVETMLKRKSIQEAVVCCASVCIGTYFHLFSVKKILIWLSQNRVTKTNVNDLLDWWVWNFWPDLEGEGWLLGMAIYSCFSVSASIQGALILNHQLLLTAVLGSVCFLLTSQASIPAVQEGFFSVNTLPSSISSHTIWPGF